MRPTSAVLLLIFLIGEECGCVLSGQTTVMVGPDTLIQPLIDSYPPGTTYIIQPGVHRLETLRPKTGDVIQGLPGAVLSGAALLTAFRNEGDLWSASAVSFSAAAKTESRVPCLGASLRCRFSTTLFMDDRELTRVESRDDVTQGKWFFDEAKRKLYVASDPAGHQMELSAATVGISGDADRVIIRGLRIEKYANHPQHGAIHMGGARWTIENNELRFNAGAALFLNSGAIVRSNFIHHNGQLGIGGSGKSIRIEENEVAYNNTAGFDYMGPDGEAGGIKIVSSKDVLVRRNTVHDNNGPGIWLDTDNRDWTVESNRLYRNREAGILAEAGYAGVIRFNLLEDEALDADPSRQGLWWRGAIMLESSRDTDVFANTLVRCGNGISIVSNERGAGAYGLHAAQNISIHENTIILPTGVAAGLVADTTTPHGQAYYSWNNHFTANEYVLKDVSRPAFVWFTGGATYKDLTLQQWQNAGNDNGQNALFASFETARLNEFQPYERVRTVDIGPSQAVLKSKAASLMNDSPKTGERGTISAVAGPIRYEGDWWWNVRLDDGTRGWLPRNWLRPAQSDTTTGVSVGQHADAQNLHQ